MLNFCSREGGELPGLYNDAAERPLASSMWAKTKTLRSTGGHSIETLHCVVLLIGWSNLRGAAVERLATKLRYFVLTLRASTRNVTAPCTSHISLACIWRAAAGHLRARTCEAGLRISSPALHKRFNTDTHTHTLNRSRSAPTRLIVVETLIIAPTSLRVSARQRSLHSLLSQQLLAAWGQIFRMLCWL